MGVYLSRLRTVFGTVFGNPDLRCTEIAFSGFNAAEWGTWIAVLVYAFEVGGATASGVVAVVQLIPSALFAPFAAVLGDHYRRENVLVAGYVAQTVSVAATAAALLAGASVPIVYGLAAVAATSFTLTRPIQGALLPMLARTPEELTSANVVSGWIESLSMLIGPAATAAILAVWQPGAVFAVMSVVLAASALFARRIRTEGRSAGPGSVGAAEDAVGVVGTAFAGFATLAKEPVSRALVGLGAAEFVLVGALDVLLVVLALQVLRVGNAGVGLLNSAFGLGGVLGGAATVLLVGRRRLASPLLAGAVLAGMSFALIGGTTTPFVAVALLAVAGAGRSLSDVAGRTMLQRVVQDDVMSRVFGVLEGMQMAALAVGSITAPALVALLGPRGAFVAAGAFLPALALLTWPRLAKADRDAKVPTHEIALLRGIEMFAPLGPTALEGLAAHLEPLEVIAGTVVIREGEVGDRFYILAEGEVAVSASGREVVRRGATEFFGEIALLRNVPRTATVTARTRCLLYSLEREPFLEAVTGHPRSLESARSTAAERMRDGPRNPGDGADRA